MQVIATIAQGQFDQLKKVGLVGDAIASRRALSAERRRLRRAPWVRIGEMRPVFEWNLGSRSLQLGKRTLVMGVINVTPDSFSDGGTYFDRDHAVERGRHLLDDGADILDVGGESTRPGAKVAAPAIDSEKETTPDRDSTTHPVNEKEELDRIIPVIVALKKKQPQTVISVDTYKANVARAAVEAGAEI